MTRKCRFEPGDLPGFMLPSSAENRSLAPDTWFDSRQLAPSQINTAITGSGESISRFTLRDPPLLWTRSGRRIANLPASRTAKSPQDCLDRAEYNRGSFCARFWR